MRLKTKIIVESELRRASGLGLFASIIKSGDDSAGQIYFIINKRNQEYLLVGPPMGTSFNDNGEKLWSFPLGNESIELDKINLYLQKIEKFDRDIYVVEIEDKMLKYRPAGVFLNNEDLASRALKQQAELAFK